MRHTHKLQRGPYLICTSRNKSVQHQWPSANVVKSKIGCSQEGHSRRFGANVGNESAESCKDFQSLRHPLVIRPLHHTHIVVVRRTDELCSKHKWVSRVDALCIRGQVSAEWSRCPSSMEQCGNWCQRQCGSVGSRGAVWGNCPAPKTSVAPS